MAITITTLSGDAGIAATHTYAELYKGINEAVWVQTGPDLGSSKRATVSVRQSKSKASRTGSTQRSAVSFAIESQLPISASPTGALKKEAINVTLSLTRPQYREDITDAEIQDIGTQLESFLTATTWAQLLRGEV